MHPERDLRKCGQMDLYLDFDIVKKLHFGSVSCHNDESEDESGTSIMGVAGNSGQGYLIEK